MTATATSASAAATPTRIDFRNIGYNVTIWENENFTGRWQYFDRAGYYKTSIDSKSGSWTCGLFTAYEMCSVAYCVGDQVLGWRGGSDYYKAVVLPPWVDRIKIVCGGDFADPGCEPESSTTTRPIFAATVLAPTPDTTDISDTTTAALSPTGSAASTTAAA